MGITHPPKNPLFSTLTVEESMRRHVISLFSDTSIDTAIRTFIKYKIDAVLVHDGGGYPAGVVTKTETMAAYYAGLPIETQLADIMGSPVIDCRPADSLESALLIMQQAGIHRIYVTDSSSKAVGTLAYPDIVGILYKYCGNCNYSLRRKTNIDAGKMPRYLIKEVMSPEVISVHEDMAITDVIETLSSFRFGALLIVDSSAGPSGVISKTDLALAYCRGVAVDNAAKTIMKSPVRLCRAEESLEEGVRRMVFSEISRLFVLDENNETVTGVLSLTDAARIRSGSCQACSSTRIRVKE